MCPECELELVYPRGVGRGRRRTLGGQPALPQLRVDRHRRRSRRTLIQRFDETLDRGTEALVADLRQLTRANMEDDVERFVHALNAGHVLPEDF